MASSIAPFSPTLGFLSVLESPQFGFVGGLLTLNSSGRPREFHCTAPLRPNRAQQILYGPTLRPYLCGEQIGATLLGKCKVLPALLLVDAPDALSVREQVDVPVALLATSAADTVLDELRSGCAASEMAQRQWAGQRLAADSGQVADLDTIVQTLDAAGVTFDLAEPFTRIRLAIEEAQGLAGEAESTRRAA